MTQQTQSFKGIRPAIQESKLLITHEPIYLKDYPEEIIQKVNIIFKLIEENPKQAIKELNDLANKYPRNPVILSMLATAYLSIDEQALHDKFRKENYQYNPKNIFARCEYAKMCLEQERFNEIPAIFNNTFNLELLYPEQTSFNPIEVILFYTTIGFYFIHSEQFVNAEICVGILGNMQETNSAAELLAVPLYMALMEKITAFLPEDLMDEENDEDSCDDDDCDDCNDEEDDSEESDDIPF